MMWYSWTATLLLMSPPPCVPGDLDRFPRLIWVEECERIDEVSPRLWRTYTWNTMHRIEWRETIALRLAWLEANRAMRKPHEWDEWNGQIEEQYAIRETWEVLEDAWKARDWYRRDPTDALMRLRERIGEEAYFAGRIPSILPLHRYVRVD